MEHKPKLADLINYVSTSKKRYTYGLKEKPFTYGILPDINNGDQAQYKYKAKIINLEEKCDGFAAVPGQDVIYQVNAFYLCFDGPKPL